MKCDYIRMYLSYNNQRISAYISVYQFKSASIYFIQSINKQIGENQRENNNHSIIQSIILFEPANKK